MYGLGFRLLESPEDNDKELGAELLQGIIEDRPRAKKSAAFARIVLFVSAARRTAISLEPQRIKKCAIKIRASPMN